MQKPLNNRMKTVFKNLLSFILPITVLLIVPYFIEDNRTVHSWRILVPGLMIVCLGLAPMVLTIFSFIRRGKGTLAPWSPTQKLVVTGLYRYVRNPMILGVFVVLLGESFIFLSLNILIWAASFFVINTVYFVFSEEPGLEKRFGNEYLEYKKHVRRWIPRVRPYKP